MNHDILSRRDFIKVLGVSSAGLMLTDVSRVLAQSSSEASVEELAKTGFSVMTEEQIKDWIQSYQALDFDQLERLDDLLAQSLYQLIKDRSQEAAPIVDGFRQLRGEANKMSFQSYKVPFNKLESSQRNIILDSMKESAISQTIRSQVSSSGGCQCNDYPFTTNPGGYASSGNGITYISAGQLRSNCSDCDWDVAYPRNRQNLKYCNAFAEMFYNDLSGRFIYRRTSTNTRVVYGWWRTLFYLGSAALLPSRFRLD